MKMKFLTGLVSLSLLSFATSAYAVIALDAPITVSGGIASFQFHSTISQGKALFSDVTGNEILLPDVDANFGQVVTVGMVDDIAISIDKLSQLIAKSGTNEFHVGLSTTGSSLGTVVGDDFLVLRLNLQPESSISLPLVK